MSHLKRKGIPHEWPVKRKGTTFVVKPVSRKGIPVLIVLRDVLKVAENRKEVKKAIHRKNILVNNKVLRDEKRGMTLFDTLTIVPSKKHYRLELSDKGKFSLNEIKENESKKKIEKIIEKRILKGKKVQLNLYSGGNILSDISCKTNDSIILELDKKKVEKCLPLKKKSKILVFAGKHSGEKGEIEELIPERKMAKIKRGKDSVNILIKQLMAVE